MGYNKEDDVKVFNNKEVEFVEVGIGEVKDFEGKDLIGKVVVVKWGSIVFVDKVDNVKKVGVIGMVVYNNFFGEIEVNVSGMFVLMIKFLLEDGEKFVSVLKVGEIKIIFKLMVLKVFGE